MEKRDAVVGEDWKVAFTAAADEIVHDRNFMSGFAKMKSDMGTDETATAGYEYMQEVVLLQEPFVAEFAEPFSISWKSR
jgi:hypothetical protein